MGWSVKKDVSVNGGAEWSQILLQPGAAVELEKPPSMRLQQKPEFLKCPRCGSTNTKFCYYNNYNRSQPRHFCKACKRHWTKGGTLRNVPVGGGRKSKRPKRSTSATPISFSTTNAAVAQQRQDCPNFPFPSTANLDQKIMSSSTLYHNLSRSSSLMLRDIEKTSRVDENGSNDTTNSNVPASQIENTECPFSRLGIFDMNSCLNVYQDYTWNLDSAAESTITSVKNPAISSVQQWQTVESCSDTMDLANDWNWDEIDELVSPDQFKYITSLHKIPDCKVD